MEMNDMGPRINTSGDLCIPTADRLKLAADATLGVGNFLHRALAVHARRDEPMLWLETPLRTFWGESYETLSLAQFHGVAERYAAFYHGAGVRPRDPIGVYIDEGAENYVHLVALTSLGAIIVPVNEQMAPEKAAAFLRQVRVAGVFLGSRQRESLERHLDLQSLRIVATPQTAAAAPRGSLPARYPYPQHGNDACIVCHSSGTTGDSKAVIEQHGQFFTGTRHRLNEGHFSESERVLLATPHSHSAGITHFMITVTSGVPAMLMTSHGADAILPAIQRFKPTVVAAFARTFSDLGSSDLRPHDLSSVERWLNLADSAHEKHIRKLVGHGSHLEDGRRVPGSTFVDQLGSTEMGFSLFQKKYMAGSNDYGRSIGRPIPMATVAVFDDDDRALTGACTGRLGVVAPSVTEGYWNDSQRTCQSRIGAYWLTGDLVRRDAEGIYYHLDRVGDEIRTLDGVAYSLPLEEVVMQSHGDILDCSVVAMKRGDRAEPAAVVSLVESSRVGEAELLSACNARLRTAGLQPLARLAIARAGGDWPLGPTGKLLKRVLRERLGADL
jgi:long-chain acyl-CoA synthetase